MPLDGFRFAASEGRVGLLAEMLETKFGKNLSPAERRAIFSEALRTPARLDMVEFLITRGSVRLSDFTSRDGPLVEVCRSPAPTEVKLTLMRRLLAWGASARRTDEALEPTPLQCAVSGANLPLIDFLLQARADPNESPGLIVVAGHKPDVVQRQLTAGADPRQ